MEIGRPVDWEALAARSREWRKLTPQERADRIRAHYLEKFGPPPPTIKLEEVFPDLYGPNARQLSVALGYAPGDARAIRQG